MKRATWLPIAISASLICGCGEPQPADQQAPPTAEAEDSSSSAPAEIAESEEPVATGAAAEEPTSSGEAASGSEVEESIQTVVDGIGSNQPEVIWDAMPKPMRANMERLLHNIGFNMDAEFHGRIVGSLRKFEGVLQGKKDFILQNPQIAGAGIDPDQLSDNWDALVGLLSTLLDSELTDLKALQKMDVRAFLQRTGGQLMQQIADVSATMPEDPFRTEVTDKLADLEIELVEQSGQNATLLLKSPGEEPREVAFKRIANKWVPAELNKEYMKATNQLGLFLNVMIPAYFRANKEEILGQFDELDAALDQAAGAENLEDFNAAFVAVIERGTDLFKPFTDPAQIMAGARRKPAAPEAFVTVQILDELEESRRDAVGKQLLELVEDADNNLVTPSTEDGKTNFRVSPVDDIQAFAQRLSFATVGSIDEEQRLVVIELQPATREPIAAPRIEP